MNDSAINVRGVDRTTKLSPISITVESPTDGVALVDVDMNRPSTTVPLHWRVGDWTKPPLDISVTPEGRLQRLQFVIQDEEVGRTGVAAESTDDQGVPLFDVDRWPPDRYLDVRALVRAARLASGELAILVGNENTARWLRVGDGLAFGLDASGRVSQLVVGPLDAEQWRVIDKAKV